MHRVVTMKARRLKIEFRAQLLQKLFAWLFPNSHSAIALHVAVAAHRTQPGPRLPNLSAQKHEVDDLLNVGDSVLMLGQAHRPAKDHALRFNEDVSRIFDLAFRDARLFEDVAPVRLAECRREFIKTARIFLDELLIKVQSSWGCLKRVSPVSGSGLMCTILQPRRFACSSEVSIRGWFVPGFWPMTKIASARSKSSSVTVPLPKPIDSFMPVPLDSWHMFEQSGRLLVPNWRTNS